jgi:hypothetical protein
MTKFAKTKKGIYNQLFTFIRWGILLGVFLLLPKNAYLQEALFLKEIMSEVRKKGHSEKRVTQKSGDPEKILNELTRYVNDPSEDVRYTAMCIGFECYKLKNDDPVFRKRVVNFLTPFCKDSSGFVWQRVTKLLLRFCRAEDFTLESKQIIRTLLQSGRYDAECFLLAGACNLTDQERMLRDIIQKYNCGDPKYFCTGPAWPSIIALARMGDIESIDYCIQVIENMENIDERISGFVHILSYIRQPRSIDILVKYLFSDAHMECDGDDGHRPCTPHTDYILPLLAESIEGFAVPRKEYYVKEDVKIARAWIKANPRYKIIR